MITSFFSTSKPIHFLVLLSYLFVIFIVARLDALGETFGFVTLIKELVVYLIVLSSVLMLDFFVRKNHLTRKNSYKILIFTLLLGIFPIVFKVDNVLVANLLVLLAFRRTVSIRSRINIKKKLFDASFWIGAAALFYFWSILFFGIIIAALLLYAIAQVKNWIAPFAGLLCITVLAITYSLLINNDLSGLLNYLQSISFDITVYNSIDLIIAMTIVTSLSLWALFFYVKNLKEKTRANRPAFLLVVIAMLISVVIIAIAPNKNGSEFIFGFAFLAIIITNYLETIKERWFAELFVWILVATPLAYFLL